MTVEMLGTQSDLRLDLYDYEPALEDFRSAVIEGLGSSQKRLPCKFFYDRAGSRLFDQICGLGEYYPTRTELAIMRRHGSEMAGILGSHCLLVEYGSGSSLKTRVLLSHLRSPAGYVPIDISRGHLIEASQSIAAVHPRLEVLPVCADYTAAFKLPTPARKAASVAAYFPGSTIGNFEPEAAASFLTGVRRLCGPRSGLLIGVDLKKDPTTLHAAYNDAAGVTAAFNLNLLKRINSELGADFDLDSFRHYAHYNPRLGRIEMHLVSLAQQEVRVGVKSFNLEIGESIHTENCYKYTLRQFKALAASTGYSIENVWVDEDELFSVQFLRAR